MSRCPNCNIDFEEEQCSTCGMPKNYILMAEKQFGSDNPEKIKQQANFYLFQLKKIFIAIK